MWTKRKKSNSRLSLLADQTTDYFKTGGAATALEVKICSNATPIPRQWDTYISNYRNKTNLCEFVSNSLCQIGQEKLIRSCEHQQKYVFRY